MFAVINSGKFFQCIQDQAEDAPSRSEVFPVIMRPSLSSMAAAGAPVSSSRCNAAVTTLRSSLLTCACFSRSSIL